MNDDFREGMYKLAGMYVNDFIKKPEETLKMFCHTKIPLEVMNSVYGYMVNDKSIEKIEDLTQEIKTKLWNHIKEMCPTADKEKVLKLCRCIWAINFILEK